MFELEKWYSDCVSPEGDALVWYTARLCWGVLHTSYDSHLRLCGTSVEQRDTGGPEADWDPIDGALSQRIFESPDGFVDWSASPPAPASSPTRSPDSVIASAYG